MPVTIKVGNALDVLAGMASESAHCVVTSPPYWGLRDYGIPPVVWGGDRECEHLWGHEIPGDTRGGSGPGAKESYAGGGKGVYARQVARGSFCQKCGAWMGALGLEPAFDLHLQNLVAVFREVRRVLRKDGTLWLNYGDAHCSIGHKKSNSGYGTTGLAGGKAQEHTPLKRENNMPNLKHKDLMMMPARVALALQADGWWLRQQLPWLKRNPMPQSARDRPSSSVEFVYMLSKSPHAFYDAESVRVPQLPQSVERLGRGRLGIAETPPGQPPHSGIVGPRKKRNYKMPDGWDTGKGAHGSFHRKGREKGVKPDKQIGSGGRNYRNSDLMFQSLQQPYGLISAEDGAPLAIDVTTHGFKEAHFATFPPRLAEPFIKAGTSERGCCGECGATWERVIEKTGHTNNREPAHVPGNTDTKVDSTGWQPTTRGTNRWRPTCSCDAGVKPCTVLDPFAGAGTVGLVAQRLQRFAILIEISPEYAEMARKRIEAEAPLFAEVKVPLLSEAKD